MNRDYREYVGLADVTPNAPQFVRAEGNRGYDNGGNSYIDLSMARGATVFGHGNLLINNMATWQMGSRPVSGFLDDPSVAQFAKALSLYFSSLPQGETFWEGEWGNQAVFTDPGLGAMDFALKTVRDFTGGGGVVLMKGSRHANGHGAFQPHTSIEHRMSALSSRVDFDWVDPFASDVEKEVDNIDWGSRSAIVVEPVQSGDEGFVILPARFIRALRSRATDESVLFVMDESFSGFGRTGKMFAQETLGVTADITILGGAGGGGFPFGAVVAPEVLLDSVGFEGVPDSQTAAHPVVCSAGLSTFTQITEGTLAKARKMSDKLFDGIGGIASEFPGVIEHTTGVGLAISVVLPEGIPARRLREAILHEGVLVGGGGDHVIELTPSLIVSEDEADEALASIYEAVANFR